MINPVQRLARIEALIDGPSWEDESARRDAIALELTELMRDLPRPVAEGVCAALIQLMPEVDQEHLEALLDSLLHQRGATAN